MALVYKRSTREAARRYERSSGMEPNPGVSALTVVNGRGHGPQPNPFQWISGRGQRHVHESPAYRTISGAKRWKAKRPDGRAQLYPVDERGTIVSRPVPQRTLASITSNRRSKVAYNVGALRRAIRSNSRMRPNQFDEDAMYEAMASPIKTGQRPHIMAAAKRTRAAIEAAEKKASRKRASKKRASKKVGGTTERKTRGGMSISTQGRKRASKKAASRKAASRKAASRKAASRKRASKKAASRKAASRKAASRKRASKKAASRKRASRKAASRKRASKKAASKRATRRGGSRRARATRRGGSRRASRRTSKRTYFRQAAVRMTGRDYLDKYIGRGLLPTIARVRRLRISRSGSSPILTYSIGTRVGRLSKRPMSKKARITQKGYAIGATYRGRRKRKMASLAANGRRRSRRSRRASVLRNTRRSRRSRRSRRGSRRASMLRNGRRRSRRASRRSRRSRRGSRRASRRASRRRSRLRPNMLATSKVRWSGRGQHRMGSAAGRHYQLVEYGSKSGKFKRAGYPVLVPSHVSMTGYVRKFRFGGAAKDAHLRAKSSGYAERRKYARRRSLKANRRHSMATRRRSRKVTRNGRRRRRAMRPNFLGGGNFMEKVAMPVGIGVAGFAAARVLSNSLANIEALRNTLDQGASAADAGNTKIAANAIGIAATLGLGLKVPAIKRHQGALITGMGLALADRLISRFAPNQPFLSGFGEYVSSPLGEYVTSLGEYVASPLGEYVQQPMGGLGQTMYAAAGLGQTMYAAAGLGQTRYAAAGLADRMDPGDQGAVDGLHDIMEAAAGTAYEAAAGIGSYYAAAGLGDDQPPFVSTQTPAVATRPVTGAMASELPVEGSVVTPEGKGYAGGLFAKHLFAGMLSG